MWIFAHIGSTVLLFSVANEISMLSTWASNEVVVDEDARTDGI
jgi:hypothetical protein